MAEERLLAITLSCLLTVLMVEWLSLYSFIRTIAHFYFGMSSEKQKFLIEEKWVSKSPFYVPSIEGPT